MTNLQHGRHAAAKMTLAQRVKAAANRARRRAARTAAQYEAWADTTTEWEFPA